MESLALQTESLLKTLEGAKILRIPIGGPEKIYLGDHRKPNGVYIENAVDRALEVYQALPACPRILKIRDCPDFTLPDLPAPAETRGGDRFWYLKDQPVFLRRLFREIVKAELDSTGWEDLVGNVQFFSRDPAMQFCLRDDREAEIRIGDPSLLAIP